MTAWGPFREVIMNDLFIHYQNRKTPLPVPPAWKIFSFADFGDSPGVKNIREKTLDGPAKPHRDTPFIGIGYRTGPGGRC